MEDELQAKRDSTLEERKLSAAQADYAIKLEAAHGEAMLDAEKFGDGWVHIVRQESGYPTAERVHPDRVRVRDA
jgi:hypothetical protein